MAPKPDKNGSPSLSRLFLPCVRPTAAVKMRRVQLLYAWVTAWRRRKDALTTQQPVCLTSSHPPEQRTECRKTCQAVRLGRRGVRASDTARAGYAGPWQLSHSSTPGDKGTNECRYTVDLEGERYYRSICRGGSGWDKCVRHQQSVLDQRVAADHRSTMHQRVPHQNFAPGTTTHVDIAIALIIQREEDCKDSIIHEWS